jgi:hypothetical protein
MAAMGDTKTPIEVEASLGDRGYEELVATLEGLGYEPKRVGAEGRGQGDPHVILIVREALPPDEVNQLVDGVASWIRHRPIRPGKFRRRHPRPITLSVAGPSGEVMSRTVVERE